jgi:hypothetical protein
MISRKPWPFHGRKEAAAMTEQTTSDYGFDGREATTSGWATGLMVFAGMMMIMAGAFQALSGIVTLFQNEFYVATRNYLLQLDANSWGWIHLLLGLLVLFAGLGLLAGQTWGRAVGITLAVLGALATSHSSRTTPSGR